jgi:hypothetical protein
MGNKYEVNAWVKDGDGYKYIQKYSGEWLIVAFMIMVKSKQSGCGCVKLEWR